MKTEMSNSGDDEEAGMLPAGVMTKFAVSKSALVRGFVVGPA